MPAVPQIPKIIKFTLDVEGGSAPEDFSMDVIAAAVVPAAGETLSTKTLDGVNHQDTEPETESLDLTAILDWDTVRPGLAAFLKDHVGERLEFHLNVYGLAAPSTTKPAQEGICIAVSLPYGGEGNTFVEGEVSMPISGAVTLITAP